LFSPFLLPGSFYEISETGDYSLSAAGRLAMDGYDVWLVDQRRTGLAPGACEQGEADCSVMANWDFATLSDDGLLALSMARTVHPTKKPVIGGFSAGSNTALALANRVPQAISGLFLYEGTFYTQDPAIIAHNSTLCQNLDAALDAGQSYDASAQLYGPLLDLAATAPDAPSPFPMFPPGTTNYLAMLYVFSMPAPPEAVAPTPGFVRCIADWSTQTFLYTNPARLFSVGPLFDNYAPIAAARDLACGLAGVDQSHVDHLDQFHGDLLVFVEGAGFGQAMFDTVAALTNAKKVTIEEHPEWGESDPYFHVDWDEAFYAPLKTWLDKVKF
jgi:pimeloyl-ACP methyl ester carboxylesterase